MPRDPRSGVPDASDPEEDLDDLPLRLRGPSMRIRILAMVAVYLLVVSLAAYEARTLIGSLLGSDSPSSVIEDDEEHVGEESNQSIPDHTNRTRSDDTDHIIFSEGFDSQDPHWFWYWRLLNGTERSLNLRDGLLFLNLTEEVDREDKLVKVWVDDCGEDRGNRWLYISVEIRLRCSDDNGWKMAKGGG